MTFLCHLERRAVRFPAKTDLGGDRAELRDGGLVGSENVDSDANE